MSITLEEDDLGLVVEAMSDAERHALPFGAVRLDRDYVVKFYSEREARGSGMGHRNQLGRQFFADIAPCFANDNYLGRIERDRAEGDIDIEMGWIGDFADENSELRVRIVSAPDGGLWIFTMRGSDRAAA